MPIQISPVSALNLFQIKNALDKLGREGFKLINPSEGGSLFLSALPDLNEMDEGSAVFVHDGANWKLAFKINNARYTITLTAE